MYSTTSVRFTPRGAAAVCVLLFFLQNTQTDVRMHATMQKIHTIIILRTPLRHFTLIISYKTSIKQCKAKSIP